MSIGGVYARLIFLNECLGRDSEGGRPMNAAIKCDDIGELVSVAVCIKEPGGRIVAQNGKCRAICGNHTGGECSTGCMQLLRKDASGGIPVGARLFQGKDIGNQNVDVVMTFDGHQLVTVLVPCGTATQGEMDKLPLYGLSAREIEIATLVIMGFQNREIAQKLHVALSTVKKHLFNIYKKMPGQKISARRQK